MDRPSPWHGAPSHYRIEIEVDRVSSLIANLTPDRRRIRVGVLVDGKESSVVIRFDMVAQYFDKIADLILQNGKT